MKKLFILSCLLLSACSDVPLNQNADTLIQNYHDRQNTATTAQKDSYYYLLGIGASDEPLQAGKAYHDELGLVLNQSGNLDENIHQLNQKHNLNGLSKQIKTDDDIFCKITSDNDNAHDCFKSLAKSDTDISPHPIIHERYLTFLTNPPALIKNSMRVDVQIPDYRVLIYGQRVHLIHHLNNGPKQSMTALSQELTLLRQHLANANTLIEKMIYANLIINQLQAMTLFKSQNPDLTTDIIPPLTADELSLNHAWTAEFMMNYETFENLERLDYGVFEKLKMTLLYNKNKTLNQVANFYQQGIDHANLSAPEIAKRFDDELTPPKIDYTNYIGSTLANIAPPDYRHYAVRIKSLNNLITIANHHINGTPLNNVFAPTLTGSLIESTHICLQNPTSGNDVATTKQDKKFECLNI
ncbi:hypothetical protein [Moraxella bovis]|uniref:Lipoprotein n=1 Tax=Moraxella bovis TaxID=476 RepID=A0ABY6M768_MORBO|nr:hypothetical protein [Moraxella bovis]AWY21378.1 hypothetical protein DQF64_13310 [Moraxella bovis]OOR89167.1 hypothetical protein B0182_08095 [Moraxella bovis]UZA03400.1 hypothetical protein LP092_01140 [Moraxella bovis]UZA08272.1 hypothetical protein LP108_10620 [Moraxella bovis]UZA16905.1 hypothetical protein LP109_00825 [Moraxella bovis]